MNWKKIGMTALLSTLAILPAYAEVVTGSQTDMNMDLKYPLVYTENTVAQTAINTDIAAYVGEAKDAYYNRHVYQVSQSYKVMYEDKDIVSLLLTTYYYRQLTAPIEPEAWYTTRERVNGFLYITTSKLQVPNNWILLYETGSSPFIRALVKEHTYHGDGM